MIYTTRNDHIPGAPPMPYYPPTEKAILFQFPDGSEPELIGDVHISLKHRGVITDSLICRFAFNTAFIHPRHKNLTFNRNTLSPDEIKKDSRIA